MASLPIQDAAIIVGRREMGEADRVLRLVTSTHGRIEVVARGARRSRRRFGGALDVGTRALARWQRGRGPLPTLVELSEVRAPRRARESWERLALLAYGCELVDVLSGPAVEPRLHRLLEVWLEVLEGEGAPGAASRVALEAKALTFAGLLPALSRCARCGEPNVDPVVWSHEEGGALHGGCGGGEETSVAALDEIEALRRSPLRETVGARIAMDTSWLLSDFVRYQCQVALKSRAALSTLEGA